MSTTVLLGLTSVEKIGGKWILRGAVTFQIYWPPWASGSRSLMLRAAISCNIVSVQWPTILNFSKLLPRVLDITEPCVVCCFVCC